MNAILDRCGLGSRPAERTLWVGWGDDDPTPAAEHLLDELRIAFPRFRLLFTTASADLRDRLRERHEGSLALPPPFELGPFLGLFLTRLRVAGMLCFAGEGGVGPGPRAAGERRGLPVLEVEPGTTRVADLTPALRQDPKSRVRPARPWERRALAWRTTRFDTLESLAAALGRPETILCLGNGPSSEDPQLAQVQYDSLFRVNWEWKAKALLQNADMVFTGNARSFRELPSAIFGFQSAAAELNVLRHSLPWRVFRPLRYATLEGLPTALGEDWGAKPTNGAAMVALAAALAPRRLILAGIDLYAHPEGGYPWDPERANAYHAPHDRDVELAILERAFAGFDGEIVILSDVLRSSLEQRKRQR
jgi:hypothetical protein